MMGNEWYAKPDWQHWAEVDYVDSWQGTALANDIDPVTYTEPMNTSQRAVLTTIMPENIRGRYKAARENFGSRELMLLRDFAAWAMGQGWAIPEELSPMAGEVPGMKKVRISVSKQQDKAILEWLKASGYNPLNLPVGTTGKAGIRSECKAAMRKSASLFQSDKVFITAWDRLRANGETKAAE